MPFSVPSTKFVRAAKIWELTLGTSSIVRRFKNSGTIECK